MIIVLGISILIGAIFVFSQIPEETAESKFLREREEMLNRNPSEKIAMSKQNPELYWSFTYVPIYKNGAFFKEYAKDDSNRVDKSTYCVVVMLTAIKNIGSPYYLEDSFDNGKINLSLKDFSLGSTSSSVFTSKGCNYVLDLYPITKLDSFVMTRGETRFFMFELKTNDVNSVEQLKYKSILIAGLGFQ